MADVIRVQRSVGYTVLPNGILRDTGLSLKTKGLFAIILSLPETWDYSVAGLATVAGCGRDAIRSALGEMEQAGYLTRTRSHGEDGKFAGVIYDIRDVAEPLSETRQWRKKYHCRENRRRLNQHWKNRRRKIRRN